MFQPPDSVPTSVFKIRSLNENEYEALIENMSTVIGLLLRLDLHYQAWQVQQIRDYIVERRMRIRP